MFGPSIPIFRLFGLSIRVDLSWLLIAALVTWSLAVGVFPATHPGLSQEVYWVMGVVGALGLFFSIVLHELAHSVVATRHGIPVRAITLFIFGGVAEMSDEPPDARSEFRVAIAGPLASVAIAALCYSFFVMGRFAAWPAPVTAVLAYLAFINLILVAFNLVPAFPLDGGRVLRSIIWKRKRDLRWATRITARIGQGFGMFLVILGVLSILTGNFIGGVWWILIGLFLRSAAQMSYQQVIVRHVLAGEPVDAFMEREPKTVPVDASVAELVEDYVYRYHHKMFPVVRNGDFVGCVSTRQIKSIPRQAWSTTGVRDIVTPCDETNTIHSGANAFEALSKIQSTGSSRLLVMDNGTLVGIVTLKDLLRLISLKLELEENMSSKAGPMTMSSN
jgi:Zn-dependent protease